MPRKGPAPKRPLPASSDAAVLDGAARVVARAAQQGAVLTFSKSMAARAAPRKAPSPSGRAPAPDLIRGLG